MRTKRSGFTLVELMVVVAIIALLATMVMAGGRIVVDNANKTSCAARLKNLGKAEIASYNKVGRFPAFSGANFHKSILADNALKEMVRLDDYLCPATADANTTNGTPNAGWIDAAIDTSSTPPMECSFAGPSSANGRLKQKDNEALAADDDEGDGGSVQNHDQLGLNILFLDGGVEFIENISGTLLKVGTAGGGKAIVLSKLIN